VENAIESLFCNSVHLISPVTHTGDLSAWSKP